MNELAYCGQKSRYTDKKKESGETKIGYVDLSIDLYIYIHMYIYFGECGVQHVSYEQFSP